MLLPAPDDDEVWPAEEAELFVVSEALCVCVDPVEFVAEDACDAESVLFAACDEAVSEFDTPLYVFMVLSVPLLVLCVFDVLEVPCV